MKEVMSFSLDVEVADKLKQMFTNYDRSDYVNYLISRKLDVKK